MSESYFACQSTPKACRIQRTTQLGPWRHWKRGVGGQSHHPPNVSTLGSGFTSSWGPLQYLRPGNLQGPIDYCSRPQKSGENSLRSDLYFNPFTPDVPKSMLRITWSPNKTMSLFGHQEGLLLIHTNIWHHIWHTELKHSAYSISHGYVFQASSTLNGRRAFVQGLRDVHSPCACKHLRTRQK